MSGSGSIHMVMAIGAVAFCCALHTLTLWVLCMGPLYGSFVAAPRCVQLDAGNNQGLSQITAPASDPGHQDHAQRCRQILA